MGLFKSVAKAINPVAAVTTGLLGGVLGGSRGGAPQFNPDLKELRADIGEVRKLRDKDITGPRKSAELALAQIEKDRMRGLGDIQAGSMGRFAALQDALARQGGVDSGARERLAATTQREATMAKQKGAADFGRLRADVTVQDLAAQEDLRNRALFSMPQMSAIPTQIQTQAAAANMRAQALHDQARKSRLAGLGKLAGMGAGFALGGGPMGAAIGGSIGGGLFSSLG